MFAKFFHGKCHKEIKKLEDIIEKKNRQINNAATENLDLYSKIHEKDAVYHTMAKKYEDRMKGLELEIEHLKGELQKTRAVSRKKALSGRGIKNVGRAE